MQPRGWRHLVVATIAAGLLAGAPAWAQDATPTDQPTSADEPPPAEPADQPADAPTPTDEPGEGTPGDAPAPDGAGDDATAGPALVAIDVAWQVVLDLSVAQAVDVPVEVTLSNPTNDPLTGLTLELVGATLDDPAPAGLEPGASVVLQGVLHVVQDEHDGIVTIVATVQADQGEDHLVSTSSAEVFVLEISAEVIERGEPAEPAPAPEPAPEVLGVVLEAPTSPQLPATGAPLPVLAALAVVCGGAGRLLLRAGRDR